MFYTKYRPQKFSEISGTSEAAEALAKEISSGKTAHAYLFVGPRGTGKTSTARILAKALNCKNISKKGDPCNECESCIAVKNGSFLDMIEIDAASNRGIDDIRQLKDNIKLAPSIGKNKVYIIDEVHMLTQEAFNALLKTLEEPPKNTVLILCTTEIHKVPETIKSRCQVFKFKRATIKQLVDKLSLIAKTEDFKIPEQDLEKIARASLGGFRDAETLLQQIIEGEIAVDSILSLSKKEYLIDLLNYTLSNKSKEAIELINSVYNDGTDLYIWVGEYIRYLRDLLLYKSGCSQDLLESSAGILDDLKEQSKSVTLQQLVTYLEKFSTAHPLIKTASIAQLPVEIAILSLVADPRNDSVNNTNEHNPNPSSTEVKLKEQAVKAKIGTNEKEAIDSSEKKDIAQGNYSKADAKKTAEEFAQEIPQKISQQDPQQIAPAFALEEITGRWPEVIEKLKNINSSLLALIKSGTVNKIEGKFIIIQVYYAFHKERLENQKNRSIVEKVLQDVFCNNLSIKCELSTDRPKKLSDNESGVLTDYNVVVPAGVEPFDRDKVINMLDGGLPI